MKQKYIFTPKINSPKCWSTSEFDSILYFQNLDTFYNGRCYTFKPQQVKVPIIHPINVVIKNSTKRERLWYIFMMMGLSST